MVPVSLLALALSYWLPRTFERDTKQDDLQLHRQNDVSDGEEDVELLKSHERS